MIEFTSSQKLDRPRNQCVESEVELDVLRGEAALGCHAKMMEKTHTRPLFDF